MSPDKYREHAAVARKFPQFFTVEITESQRVQFIGKLLCPFGFRIVKPPGSLQASSRQVFRACVDAIRRQEILHSLIFRSHYGSLSIR